MRHSKNPTPGVLDIFALLECRVQPQKYLLSPLLRLRGIKPKAQQITVDILARLFEQPRDLILQSQVPVPRRDARQFPAKRVGRHSLKWIAKSNQRPQG